jgi:tripartite-type tricarboxylate transporter receptor subunit TctC
MPHIKSGKLIPMAVASPKRLNILPDVPTFIEAGYPLVISENWYGFFAPTRTPQSTINIFYTELQKVLSDLDTKNQLIQQGVDIRQTTPNEANSFINLELTKWAKMIKISGATLD